MIVYFKPFEKSKSDVKGKGSSVLSQLLTFGYINRRHIWAKARKTDHYFSAIQMDGMNLPIKFYRDILQHYYTKHHI